MRKKVMDLLGRGMGKRTGIRYIKNKGMKITGRRVYAFAGQALVMALFLSLYVSYPACAAAGTTNTGVIKTGFSVVYDIIAAIISSVGQLYLLWGVFEWATALNSQDGTMQSMAFKRIAAGLIACITPQLIPLITSGISK